MLTTDDLHERYESTIPHQTLANQGKTLNKQMANKIPNANHHFEKALQNLTSDAIFDRDFERVWV